jgi:DNA-binding NtrC family response regulator
MSTSSVLEAAAPTTGRVLVVDDEFSVRDALQGWFRKDGHAVATAADAREALHLLHAERFDVVLLDIRMPGIDGLELLRRIRVLDPACAVIMITAFATVETAVLALKEGAADYVTKPVDPDELSRLVERGLAQRQAADAGSGVEPAPLETVPLVAESPAMRALLAQARTLATSDVPLLIRGEVGSGRTRLARLIHDLSARNTFPFVALCCGAFGAEGLEGELFGHEAHAFQGARFRRRGRLEMAEGGTLLLAEVEALEPRLQVELGRVLASGRYTRLGGSAPLRADVRLIATTAADQDDLRRRGALRDELGLGAVELAVPPLRERRADLPGLAAELLASAAARARCGFEGFEPGALAALAARPWPGNVRELARTIEHAVSVGTPPRIRGADLAP